MTECTLIKSTEMFTPLPEKAPELHPCRTAVSAHAAADVPRCDEDKFGSDGFPGPLISAKMQKDELISFIQRKRQECLLHPDEPEQAYFFWLIMERFCNQSGKIMMFEIAVLLFQGYSCLMKLRRVGDQAHWCLPLATLLCSAAPADEHREEILKMGDDFASRGWIYAAHICYVVAQMELGLHPRFKLIGCDGLPDDKSALGEMIERTEVYEYVLSLTSGFGQPDFQEFKYLYACELAEAGRPAEVLDYCESIATTVFRLPHCFKPVFIERLVRLCEKMLGGKEEKPEWLLKLYRLHSEKAARRLPACSSRTQHSTQDFKSRYSVGMLLGSGGFASVYGGKRKADGTLVALKYVAKNMKFITIPGEARCLPLEVALMEMVSKPPRCENVLQVLEWFEMPTAFVLVLERPVPCMDLWKFCKLHGGDLNEPVAQTIMRQVVRAARHCCERGVFHRDIKPNNVLVNLATLEVKLIDFGCGDLLNDELYTTYSGTPAFWPPEWVLQERYAAIPATVWSLGVVLYEMVSGDVPFKNNEEIIDPFVPFIRGLSKDCYNLLMWCLDLIPEDRPTFDEILSHDWLKT